jgi:glutamate N-acetyltransferase/amino-acid N-acetyltransferase
MPLQLPLGFRVAGTHCGIKRNPASEDIALVVADPAATAAGVYTQNRVFAAPVALCRQRTPSDAIRAVVINSGNANACTGARGLRDAERMAELAATAVGARPEQVLVLSTGVIGKFLPLDCIEAGIARLAGQLATDEPALVRAARGMMTTDTRHKLSCRATTAIRGPAITVTGMAKGAAMIGPNMATMLSVLMTDAALTPADAQTVLQQAVDRSFNNISVEGHMSTNDSVLLLASGAADMSPLQDGELKTFQHLLDLVCVELARMIPDDGEGITHLVTIDVEHAPSREAARQIAKTVANSPLVKTAIHGADPNWGRIVSAVGYAGVPFDPHRLTLHLNDFLLYRDGAPVEFDAQQVSRFIRDQRETTIRIDLASGSAHLRFWTTDLTAEYVRLNADYTT